LRIGETGLVAEEGELAGGMGDRELLQDQPVDRRGVPAPIGAPSR
jgi:hypothetical protein